MSDTFNNLKTCPFCGGDAEYSWYEDESLWSHNTVFWYNIGCGDCDYIMNTCEDMQGAIDKWNKRVNK